MLVLALPILPLSPAAVTYWKPAQMIITTATIPTSVLRISMTVVTRLFTVVLAVSGLGQAGGVSGLVGVAGVPVAPLVFRHEPASRQPLTSTLPPPLQAAMAAEEEKA